jgi:serine O-acetyltransferase
VADTDCVIGNDVVLLQQVTLGVVGPYYHSEIDPTKVDPILKDGVYVSPGAKILGHITIGEWSVIGANAVVTTDVPPYSIVVGYNRILERKSSEL